jgi:TPR repeat protein
MYKDAKGVGRDINRAKRLYKKACKLGNSYGCKNLKKL